MRLTQEYLKENLKYNPDTGDFYWLKSRGCKKAGSIAGTLSKNNGYRQIQIKGKLYLAHRLAWLYMEGYSPEPEIHHINHITDDNRIDNLMETSHHCNSQERLDNTSGKSGVSFDKWHGKWCVKHCPPGGNRKNHGYFKSFEEACDAKDVLIEADNKPHCVLEDIKSWN